MVASLSNPALNLMDLKVSKMT